MTRRSVMLVVLAVTLAAAPPADEPAEVNLRIVGSTDLGGAGFDGDVAVAGTTAVVASGLVSRSPGHTERDVGVPCVPGAVKVVDLKDPKKPKLVATVTHPPGLAAVEVDALGDLVAVALERSGASCEATPPAGGVAYYDVADPAAPRLLGTHPSGSPRGPHSVSLAQREDGRLLSLSVDATGTRLHDVTDPASPAPLATWPAARSSAGPGHGCNPAATPHAGELRPGGRQAVVAALDAGVQLLDLTDPAAPVVAGHFAYEPARDGEGNAALATTAQLDDRTLVLASEEAWCDQPGGWGMLRLLEVDAEGRMREFGALQAPRSAAHPPPDAGIYGPGRALVSGQQAFVAWHAEGVRVLDLGESRVRAVAQFVPPDIPDPAGVLPAEADVTGVALLPDHLVVTDRNSGLYVLARPSEGGTGSIWDEVILALAALGIALMTAFLAVPYLLLGGSMARAMRPGRRPVGMRRR